MTDPEILQDKLLGELMEDTIQNRKTIDFILGLLVELTLEIHKLKGILIPTWADLKYGKGMPANIRQLRQLMDEQEGKLTYTHERLLGALPLLGKVEEYLDKKKIDKQGTKYIIK